MKLRGIIRRKNFLAHLSIWIIIAIVLTISLTVFDGNLIGIVYLLFFLSFVLLFQSSYSLWARSITAYSILLIVYSTIVFVLTYSFQYVTVSSLLKDVLSVQALTDIGLVDHTNGWSIFIEALAPLTLITTLVIYLRYFHDDLNRFAYLAEEDDVSLSTPLTGSQMLVQQTFNDSTLIVLNNTNSNSNQESIVGQQQQHEQRSRVDSLTNPNGINSSKTDLKRLSKQVKIENFLKATSECIWRILETHFIKLVMFMIFRLPIIDVSLINLPFLIIVIVALRYPSTSRCSCILVSWLISFIVVVGDLSNLTILSTLEVKTNHTCDATAPVPLQGKTYNYIDYIGLNTGNPLDRILVLLMTTVYSFICIHYERRSQRSYELSFGVIFTGIGRREADLGILNGIQYFCNFGFYKFGIEITCLTLIFAISHRLDSVAAIYGLILILISITTSKRTLASMWPLLNLIISILIPVQYVLRLGLPPALCESYPWESMSKDFKHWLFLSDYETPQDATLLLYDSLVLLAVCRQAVAFRLMSLNSSPSVLQRSNVHHDFAAHRFRVKYLPTEDEFEAEDCFSNYTTQSNYLKSIFYVSIYWITLAVVLIAGATKVSLFSLGYLLGCFIFLWLGNDAYLMPLSRLIFSWNWFVFYATLVIFIKVILQLYACYLHEFLLGHCYILQLLRLVCYRKMSTLPTVDSQKTCAQSLPYDELDILWDGLCLMFLLMQRIVFGSQYFKFLVQEVKAQQILASRGAELIMATQIEEAKAQDLYEREVMRSIKKKMEDLKSDSEETSKAWQRLLTLPHHHQIIRNANRHLFSNEHDDPVSQSRSDGWKFKKAFIPDPIGDELERMDEINGISAVFTRWMKGEPLYGRRGNSDATNSPVDGVREGSPSSDQADTLEEPADLQTSESLDRLGVVNSYEDISSDDDDDKVESGRIRGWWDMLNLLVYSCLLSATVLLNKLSRSYRYVSRKMNVEKNLLKKQFNLNDERFKRDPNWRKWAIGTLSESHPSSNDQYSSKQSSTSLHRIRSALKVIASNSKGEGTSSQDSCQSVSSDKSPPSGSSGQKQTNRTELTDPEYCFLKLNMFTQFCRAFIYVFISNTSLLCQLVIIFNQILTASLLSLPIPLLTFLWGTLSVPRPTKRFWKTVITYTELVVVIKYVCQFPIWNWELTNLNPFYYPNLLGIKNITIVYDLVLLLALFFHRSMLKSLGQWGSSLTEGSSLAITQSELGEHKDVPKPPERKKAAPPRAAITQEAGPDEISIFNSVNLQENLDRSIELAPRTISASMELDRTQAYQGYFQDSYQNQDQTDVRVSLVNENNQASTCCGCWKRGYNRTKRSISSFFQHVLKTPYKVQTDVYTWAFLCDFINFLILIYGFWAFGSGYANQTVASFLNENRIPFSVLIMLLAQFASIIVDRAFYLQKNIGAKLMFHIGLVIGIHAWLFFALPFTTGHTALKEYWPPRAWYVFKCFYFLLSAHQIRSGYPRHVVGNCFTNGFGYANYWSFKVYRAIPLVYDLRLYMDWIWTETTLEFRNWNIMEDMFANLFIRKCDLTLEEEYPYQRARPINRFSKYLTGGSFILLILAIIWGPLLLFSMGKTVGDSNPPVEMEFELEFVGFQPILRMRATAQQITLINEEQYDQLKAKYISANSQSFFGDYKVGDVAAIRLDGQSNAVWEISPPSKQLLMQRIKNNETLILKSSWTLYRVKKEKSQNFDVSIAGAYQFEITADNSSGIQDFRSRLYDMLANSSTTNTTPPSAIKYVITPRIFPNFLRVPETGQVSLVEEFSDNVFKYQPLRNLSLAYVRMFDKSVSQIDNSTSWWKADDLCKYNASDDTFSFWPPESLEHCDSLLVVTFNSRIFTGILALLSAPGIIGLYTTFVVFFARLIRTEPAGKVIYTEIPKVDRIYGLIMDIYMMRECKEFELEEKLFAKLLFLYRSPEMLIEWSKREDEPQLELNND